MKYTAAEISKEKAMLWTIW